MKQKYFSLFAAILCILLLFSFCSKKIVKDNDPPAVTDEQIEIYLQEGFISSNIYRIVIIDCTDKTHETIESINDKAQKRALVSLQKYMVENNMIYTDKTKAKLLNLISEFGQFSKQDISYKNNDVYYLEIKKRNIKNYIDSLSTKR